MFRTVFWLIFLVLDTLFTLYHLLIVYILGALGMKAEQEERINSTARGWARSLILFSGSKVRVEGAELVPTDRAVLFVANHQSYFDIPLLLGFVPGAKGFIAKIEIRKIPIVNTWMTKMHSLYLDRKNMRESVKTMRQAVETLRSGYSLVIFPEGTRSRSSDIAQFKRGSLSIAEKADVPIVPVTIVNSYKIFEGNRGIRIRPTEVEIHISEPILPSSVPQGTDLAALVRSTIITKYSA